MHYRTNGDGKCLYNAFSIALVENESLSGYLRDLTSLELSVNATYYADHPLINSLHKKRKKIDKTNAFFTLCQCKYLILA